MAKKSKRIEKETRRLIETISDVVVKKKGEQYKFKSVKKKTVRRMKRTCPHWIIRKGKEDPTLKNINKTISTFGDTIIDKATKEEIEKFINTINHLTKDDTIIKDDKLREALENKVIHKLLSEILNEGGITVPYWQCTICGAEFPVSPSSPKEYDDIERLALSHINQIQFWSVRMGGNSEETKVFLRLKELLPTFSKIRRQVVKQVNKREKYEENKARTDIIGQFDGFSSYTYH